VRSRRNAGQSAPRPAAAGRPEPARALITRTAGHIRHLLASFDQLAERVTALEPVVTHGEPHHANLIRAGTGVMLIDWDTVASPRQSATFG
jgi:hypothetical protein